MHEGLLHGKSVVITGSGAGIGAAIAHAAAQEGAAVVVNARSRERVDAMVEKIRATGGRAIGVAADVSDPDAAESIIDACIDEFGRIDGLINNAGVMLTGNVEDLDPLRVRRVFEINVLGTIYCGIPAIRAMKSQGDGSIVNLTSGAHMGLRDTALYGASKGANASLTYNWAAELAGTGVRVNAISPVAATGMLSDTLTQQGVADADLTGRLEKLPTAEDNAPVAVYLLSDLSREINGQMFRTDGKELFVIGRPAVLSPSQVSDHWSAQEVARVIDEELRGKLMPIGLLQLTGDYQFTTLKDMA